MRLIDQQLVEKLRDAGLRPTRQRVTLCRLLFSRGNRHVTAEALHVEAIDAGYAISLATVYNALRQFEGAGLIRELIVDGSRSYFDTNTHDHSHFYIEDDGELLDIPAHQITVGNVPAPPEGMEVSHVDVVVRLKRKAGPLNPHSD